MEGGIALFLLLLIVAGAVVAFIALGGAGALASRKRQDTREGARQGRAARNTRRYPGEDE